MQGRKPGAKGQKTAKKERNFLVIVERPKIIKMKKVKLNKKLQLNKETIAKLNAVQLNSLIGGTTPTDCTRFTCDPSRPCCDPTVAHTCAGCETFGC